MMYWAIAIAGCWLVLGIVGSFLVGRFVASDEGKWARALLVTVTLVLSILLALYFIIGTSILLMRRDDTTPGDILGTTMAAGVVLLSIWLPVSAFLYGWKKKMH